MDLRVNLSSCVPATAFETSGAALSAADLVSLRDHPKVIGLAEMMNYPGVLAGDPRRARQARRLPGRPYRRPRAARSPAATSTAISPPRIRTDHEATSAAEAREKLAKGMTILIREGSVSKDLARARRGARREHRLVHGALHRRPQSARHRRGGPPRLHDPHADRARPAAPCRLPRGELVGGERLRAARPRPRRAGLARRHRAARRPRRMPRRTA